MHRRAKTKGDVDEQLKIMVLQALAHHVIGERSQALQQLDDALVLAEPSGFIRTFIDEGAPMAQLLSDASGRGMMPAYTNTLLGAFAVEHGSSKKTGPCTCRACATPSRDVERTRIRSVATDRPRLLESRNKRATLRRLKYRKRAQPENF